jgi:hypothetical protein
MCAVCMYHASHSQFLGARCSRERTLQGEKKGIPEAHSYVLVVHVNVH